MAPSFSLKREVYLEIAERYEKYITLGVIKTGEKLPSVRAAATELRVNPNTVQRAYTLLEEKGLIRSMPKKGAFVIFGKKNEEGDVFFEQQVQEENMADTEEQVPEEQVEETTEEGSTNPEVDDMDPDTWWEDEDNVTDIGEEE